MAAPQRAGAPGMAWPARELVPGLPTRRSPGQRPDRRSRRAARSRWRTARHRQLRRALPVMQLDQGWRDSSARRGERQGPRNSVTSVTDQLDQGCVRGRPGGSTRGFRSPGRPRPPDVRTRPSFPKNPGPVGATGRPRRAMTGWLATRPGRGAGAPPRRPRSGATGSSARASRTPCIVDSGSRSVHHAGVRGESVLSAATRFRDRRERARVERLERGRFIRSDPIQRAGRPRDRLVDTDGVTIDGHDDWLACTSLYKCGHRARPVGGSDPWRGRPTQDRAVPTLACGRVFMFLWTHEMPDLSVRNDSEYGPFPHRPRP